MSDTPIIDSDGYRALFKQPIVYEVDARETAAVESLMDRGLVQSQAKGLWRQLVACQEHCIRFAMLVRWCTALRFDATEASHWLEKYGLGGQSVCATCRCPLDSRKPVTFDRVTYKMQCPGCARGGA